MGSPSGNFGIGFGRDGEENEVYCRRILHWHEKVILRLVKLSLDAGELPPSRFPMSGIDSNSGDGGTGKASDKGGEAWPYCRNAWREA